MLHRAPLSVRFPILSLLKVLEAVAIPLRALAYLF